MDLNMYSEVVAPILASLGGATVIVAAFAHFLGKVWTDRISKSNSARFNSELEALKARNTLALEEFKTKSSLSLKERESFAGISQEFYQQFFAKRIETYQSLLKIKNDYIAGMEEEFLTEELERWGDIYHSTYTSLRKLMIENQFYISNDLDRLFGELRTLASKYIKDADLVEAHYSNSETPPWENEHLYAVYNSFAKKTSGEMKQVFEQISFDVSKLRSRVEID
ncbi:hypothetical protein [Saccharophagus degradans]|uniref:Uncharacterized protein n=1 Tax=Saccharophagus degradans TaxID=86304 RepID=A0AAW7X5J5_9GAMM|nr:hypothetical protein [Saccharophagus degradans]MDO6422804.1 hypothetical protein [Saccharophagus degradans]MDO6606277.1 hypothetical protein [Saccharophagus degradans]